MGALWRERPIPMTPSRLKLRKKALAFDYDGDPINIEYYPAGIGPEVVGELKAWMARAQAADGEEESQQVLHDFGAWICTLLASWDFCLDDGVTPQPITPENLAVQLVAFPDFILQVLVAIVNDRTGGKVTGTPSSPPSDGISSPTESGALMTASLTPSDTSSLPDGLVAAAPASTGSRKTQNGATG